MALMGTEYEANEAADQEGSTPRSARALQVKLYCSQLNRALLSRIEAILRKDELRGRSAEENASPREAGPQG